MLTYLYCRSYLWGLLHSWGFSSRKPTTAAQKLPVDWQQQAALFVSRVAFTVFTYNVHPSCLVAFDETGVQLVPTAGKATISKHGQKDVSVIGVDDKRQVTVNIPCAFDGSKPRVQIIFPGKTRKCLPGDQYKLANTFFSFSTSHWSTIDTMKEFFSLVLHPYFQQKKREHGLGDDMGACVLLDVYPVHTRRDFIDWVKEKFPYMKLLYVPGTLLYFCFVVCLFVYLFVSVVFRLLMLRYIH